MKKQLIALAAMLTFSGIAGSAMATPLALNYSIEDIGSGMYNYEFDLILDNNDGSWVSGQSWDWFIFGDRKNAPSLLTNFVGDPNDLPIGPWDHYTSSGGGHNGPTFLNYGSGGWKPSMVGDSLNWSGTSNAYLGQGDMLFSTLMSYNNAVNANFEVANFIETPVPEPTSALLGLMSLTGLLKLKRKQK